MKQLTIVKSNKDQLIYIKRMNTQCCVSESFSSKMRRKARMHNLSITTQQSTRSPR